MALLHGKTPTIMTDHDNIVTNHDNIVTTVNRVLINKISSNDH
jgi:hypothetical protein